MTTNNERASIIADTCMSHHLEAHMRSHELYVALKDRITAALDEKDDATMEERDKIVRFIKLLAASRTDETLRQNLEVLAFRIEGGEHLLVGSPLDPFKDSN